MPENKQEAAWYPKTQEEFDALAQAQWEANEMVIQSAEARTRESKEQKKT